MTLMMKVTTEQSRPYVFGDFRSVHLPLMEQLGRLEEEVSQTNLNVLFFGEDRNRKGTARTSGSSEQFPLSR